MSDYTEFFLNAPSKVVKLQTLEISHPSFSKVYYIVRNSTKDVTLTTEEGVTAFFEYYPCQIQMSGTYADLDQGIEVSFGDLGEILPEELDNVYRADNFTVKPVVKYREYRSDKLNSVMNGPFNLVITSLSFNTTNATFEAGAPQVNINGSGILYSLSSQFRTLRGYL